MTYCLALRLDEGLVFLADTRTNAGVDNVSTYRKLHVLRPAPDRVFVLESAGSLATTQEVLDRIHRDLAEPGREPGVGRPPLRGGAVRRSAEPRGGGRSPRGDAAGGSRRHRHLHPRRSRSARDAPDILLVYPEGNYIRASDDRPFLQIGESKYGKFMLELAVEAHVDLSQATKIALGSMMSTDAGEPLGRSALRPRHPPNRRRCRAPGVPGGRGLAAARAAACGVGALSPAGDRRAAAHHRRRLRSGRLDRLRNSPSRLNAGTRSGE